MTNKQIRIVGKRREQIDITRLAEALLGFINSLSESDKQRLIKGGGEKIKGRTDRQQARGSAA